MVSFLWYIIKHINCFIIVVSVEIDNDNIILIKFQVKRNTRNICFKKLEIRLPMHSAHYIYTQGKQNENY